MQSKTSFFNKTVFRKNLTRFAPVWGVYTLCLILGILLMYSNGGTMKHFHFAHNMLELANIMGIVNLGYAFLVAQLLFGDLYNSRMCNMLHAFPLRREGWFVTNILSGLTFSVVPTAVMAFLSMPLLMGSIFEGAWTLSWWVFLASNLQFLCFFGLAAFSAMCVGNRFTMTAGYGLLNAGAYILYWLIDTVYTPMLYGVITPTALAENLTPIQHMTNHPFFETESNLSNLRDAFGDKLLGATASFTLTDEWWRLWVLAAVGIAFAVVALLLYRKRDLECAGDAVAFPALVPVFQVLCAIFVACAAQFFLYEFMGLRDPNYPILGVGLTVGWFIGKMLLERSTSVFRLKNWYGLGALAAVLAVTLVGTYFDVLHIEERMPAPDRIEKVQFSCSNSSYLEEEEDIQTILQLHKLALEDRAESSGSYVLGSNGQWIPYVDTLSDVIEEEDEDQPFRYAVRCSLRYELKNGNTVRREYNIWVDSPAGEIAEDILNRWEFVEGYKILVGDKSVDRLELVLADFQGIGHSYYEGTLPAELKTREAAESFLEAVKADCAAGNMAQHDYFHTGMLRVTNKRYEKGYVDISGLWVYLDGKNYSWDILVCPDSENTIRWLEDHGLMKDIEILPDRTGYR